MSASQNDSCGLAAQARNLLLLGSDEMQASLALPDVVVELACSILHPWLPSALGLGLLVDPGGRHRLGAHLHRLAPGPTPWALAPSADPVLFWYQAAPAPPRPVDTSWGQLHDGNTTSASARRLGDGQDPSTAGRSLPRKGGSTGPPGGLYPPAPGAGCPGPLPPPHCSLVQHALQVAGASPAAAAGRAPLLRSDGCV